MDTLRLFFPIVEGVCEVDTGYALVLPALAEGVLVVKEAQLFDYVVHYEVGVDLGLVSYVLFVSFTKLANLIDVTSLVRVYLEHTHHEGA